MLLHIMRLNKMEIPARMKYSTHLATQNENSLTKRLTRKGLLLLNIVPANRDCEVHIEMDPTKLTAPVGNMTCLRRLHWSPGLPQHHRSN